MAYYINGSQREIKGFASQLLKEKGAKINRFARLEKGEGIEKKEENFAEEVAKQIKG